MIFAIRKSILAKSSNCISSEIGSAAKGSASAAELSTTFSALAFLVGFFSASAVCVGLMLSFEASVIALTLSISTRCNKALNLLIL